MPIDQPRETVVRSRSIALAQWALFVVLALALGGCAGLTGALRASPDPQTPVAPAPVLLAAVGDVQIAQRAPSTPAPADTEIEEYDPWEPFNEKMFDFNRGLDRWVMKPVAKGYNKVMPDPWQEAIGNAFDNIAFVPRFVNCLVQGRFAGAGREMLRFVVNSSIGLGGLIDIAKIEGFQKCKGDTGQTLGVWGVGPGPFLVLPFLPPLTVRDAIGHFADGAMNPLYYFIPFLTAEFPMKAGEAVNDRSVNLDLYQGFEESTVEFYSALRNAYLQRRQKRINEGKSGE
jgi:phospholipid-binding lipoprotein MlaA